ncbi:hypothetical protein [Amycolatopsis suaedae]|uniref:CGNR zinc finger domain-containing protein n=1 Tax=Amycolatopsis suaedae TaxID=2510978 RepID=A0A4Q7J2G1_9PSEU|nr:hypothetical protein [Amycolatopsis suaedae]RZQ61630.1 hypothetical protein EWH70_21935 [Amycolatopsis suaedae]
MARKYAVSPPFRALDPALATAERLLADGHPGLTWVAVPLPDGAAATARLNVILAAAGARPRLVATPTGWRVEHVGNRPEVGDLVVAACALAELVAVGGWQRVKHCETCGQVFCDRTNACTRRWCARHR